MARWTAANIPNLAGRRAIVTGANSGLGFQTSLELARHGAAVVLACRDQERGNQALGQLRAQLPDADSTLATLDLADLASVRRFAEGYAATHKTLDLLVNNAGVMAIPRRLTVDGFEMQFGTNHLGHFALTGRLFPLIAATPKARVVTVSSAAHRAGQIDFTDLQGERKYGLWSAYGQSKLANLLFAFALQRKVDAAGLDVLSVAAHPGFAATNLVAAGPRMGGHAMLERLFRAGTRLVAQSDAKGALPTLYAATADDVAGGAYYGPGGIAEQRGYPRRVASSPQANDEATAQRLWHVSEELTGVRYDLLAD
jgi:NAD(P)-dependent dehydrogenase (short-subunit alcohol dehydrogenase family)